MNRSVGPAFLSPVGAAEPFLTETVLGESDQLVICQFTAF